MRRNPKIPVYFAGLVLAAAATAVSCSRDSTAPEQAVSSADAHLAQQKAQNAPEKNSWPGKYHTDALVHAYSKLSQTTKKSAKSDKCRVAIAALKEFNKSYRKDDGSVGVEDAFISADDVCGPPGSNTIPQFGTALTPSMTSAALSPQAASMVQQILNLTGSPGSISAKVARIQGSAAATLNPTEAAAVIGLGSIAVSSTDYWNANNAHWRALSANPGKISRQISVTDNAGAFKSTALPTAPRTSEMECCNPIALADASAFISSVLKGFFSGTLNWYQSVVAGAVASIVAGIQFWL